MARTATITYDDFVVAAKELQSEGQRLSFAALRLKLGGGSYPVIRRYLDLYEADGARQAVAPGVPVNLLGGMQAWFDQAKQEARQQAYAELDEQFRAVEATREAAASEIEQARLELAAANACAAQRAGQIEDLIEQRGLLREALQAAQAQAELAAVAAAEARTRLASEGEGYRLQLDQVRQAAERTQREFGEALARAQERFDAAQQLALRNADAARSEVTSRMATMLRAALEDVTASVAKTVAAVDRLEARDLAQRELAVQLASLRDEATTLVKQLAEQRSGNERLQSECDSLHDVNTALREQLLESKARIDPLAASGGSRPRRGR